MSGSGERWYGASGRGACGHCQHRERMAQNLFCAECARSYAGALTLAEETALERRAQFERMLNAKPAVSSMGCDSSEERDYGM